MYQRIVSVCLLVSRDPAPSRNLPPGTTAIHRLQARVTIAWRCFLSTLCHVNRDGDRDVNGGQRRKQSRVVRRVRRTAKITGAGTRRTSTRSIDLHTTLLIVIDGVRQTYGDDSGALSLAPHAASGPRGRGWGIQPRGCEVGFQEV